MQGFIDLHCHFVPAVDDGVKTVEDGQALLLALRKVGFDHVVATPHMRPALWDNQAPALREAYAGFVASLAGRPEFPTTALSAEHFFDDITYGRLVRGEGLPYEKGRTVLVEFPYENLPLALSARFFDLRMKRLRPIVAHPERYEPFWKTPEKAAETMRRSGGVLLMDIAALVGKYGARAQRTAEELVRCEAYYAACSDAHRPADADEVGAGIARLRALAGDDEVRRLLITGPKEILAGRVLDAFD